MRTDPMVLGAAAFSLTVGLVLYAWLVRSSRESERVHVFSWLLVALFPILLIYSFFPQSDFSADLKGATMTGAIGAFIFIWWYGSHISLRAAKFDELQRALAERTREVQHLTEQH